MTNLLKKHQNILQEIESFLKEDQIELALHQIEENQQEDNKINSLQDQLILKIKIYNHFRIINKEFNKKILMDYQC